MRKKIFLLLVIILCITASFASAADLGVQLINDFASPVPTVNKEQSGSQANSVVGTWKSVLPAEQQSILSEISAIANDGISKINNVDLRISFDQDGTATGSYIAIPFCGTYSVVEDQVTVDFGSIPGIGELGILQFTLIENSYLSFDNGILKKISDMPTPEYSLIGFWECSETKAQYPLHFFFYENGTVAVIQEPRWDIGIYHCKGNYITIDAFGKANFCYFVATENGLQIALGLGESETYTKILDPATEKMPSYSDAAGFWVLPGQEKSGMFMTKDQHFYAVDSLDRHDIPQYEYILVANYVLVRDGEHTEVVAFFANPNFSALKLCDRNMLFTKRYSENEFNSRYYIGQPTPTPGPTRTPSPTPTINPIDYSTLVGSWVDELGPTSYRGFIFNEDNTGYIVDGTSQDKQHPRSLCPMKYEQVGDKVTIYSLLNDYDVFEFEIRRWNGTASLVADDIRDYDGYIAHFETVFAKLPYDIVQATPSPIPAINNNVGQWLYGVWECDNRAAIYQFYFDKDEGSYIDFEGHHRLPMDYYADNETVFIQSDSILRENCKKLYVEIRDGERILCADPAYPGGETLIYKKIQ